MRRPRPIGLSGILAATVTALAGFIPMVTPPARSEVAARTLLAVFAHPDDEQVISPMLSRYAREGVAVHVAYATSGQKGVREHAKIPAGEALAAARAEEARCACDKLGIHPPVLMGLEDGELHAELNQTALLKELTRLLADLKPDVIVTWGPDGVTGHSDHRMVSSLVSQLVQQGKPDTSPRLFYVGLPAEELEAAGGRVPWPVAVVQRRYLPVRVPYGKEDARAAQEALACHASQFTTKEAAMIDGMLRTLENGTVHLRPWFGATDVTHDLFE